MFSNIAVWTVSITTIHKKILKHYVHIFVIGKRTLPVLRFKAGNYKHVRPGVSLLHLQGLARECPHQTLAKRLTSEVSQFPRFCLFSSRCMSRG